MPTTPALRPLRQEDLEVKASLSYIVRSCLKLKKEEKKKYLDYIMQKSQAGYRLQASFQSAGRLLLRRKVINEIIQL